MRMRDEIMTEWRPRWVMSEICAPYTEAHLLRFERVLDELEVRYS